ncbi:MAG: NUDIX hydrolase [Candidatus Binataceae bacterium]
MREKIAALVRAIAAHDALEERHKAITLEWIGSGAPIFRIRKPDIPPQHLVSYFAVIDPKCRKILLVDHKNARLWLPTGGHVEPGENPEAAVRRELSEELRQTADFLFDGPVFVTVTPTGGIDTGHTDVSLWYVLRGDSTAGTWFDAGEFNRVAWFGFDEIPFDRSDPHMRRFVDKLRARMAAN